MAKTLEQLPSLREISAEIYRTSLRSRRLRSLYKLVLTLERDKQEAADKSDLSDEGSTDE